MQAVRKKIQDLNLGSENGKLSASRRERTLAEQSGQFPQALQGGWLCSDSHLIFSWTRLFTYTLPVVLVGISITCVPLNG